MPFARMLTVLLFLSLFGCATPVVHTHTDVSRDYTWIRLKEGAMPYRVDGFVGGEHVSSYRILGFTGERYRISATGEDLYMGVDSGGSARLSEVSAKVVTAEVVAVDATIFVEVSAHPHSDYTLVIERLTP